MSLAFRPLFRQVVRRKVLPGKLLAQQTRSHSALAATISARAGGDEKEWTRHPPMAWVAASGAAVAATLWQERKSADCCGIAGVVGTKNSLDAR